MTSAASAHPIAVWNIILLVGTLPNRQGVVTSEKIYSKIYSKWSVPNLNKKGAPSARFFLHSGVQLGNLVSLGPFVIKDTDARNWLASVIFNRELPPHQPVIH